MKTAPPTTPRDPCEIPRASNATLYPHWLIVLAGVVILGMVLASLQLRWWQLFFPRPYSPPTVLLSILKEDGSVVSAKNDHIINVIQGTTITPIVDVDWGDHQKGTVNLTYSGIVVKAGEPISLDSLGVATLLAEVSTNQSIVTYSSVSLEITRNPRYKAIASGVQLTAFSLNRFEIDIRLSSDEFSIKDIYLSHVSLWLLDDSNMTLDRLPVAIVDEVSTDQPEYRAEFDGGSWIIHFSRPHDALPLETLPTHIMLTGSGWQGQQHVKFTAVPSLLLS